MTLSIVIPTFNRASLLDEMLGSIFSVDHSKLPHLQVIVVDGASTDDTKAVTAKYPCIDFYSEPDTGVYDAFNKGLSLARNNYIAFAASDDLYPAEAINLMLDDAIANQADVYCYSGQVEDMKGALLQQYASMPVTVASVLFTAPMLFQRIFRRDLIKKIGIFDLAFSIASDGDYMLRCALCEPTCKLRNTLGYIYRQHDDSLTFDTARRNFSSGILQGLAYHNKASDSLPPSHPSHDIINQASKMQVDLLLQRPCLTFSAKNILSRAALHMFKATGNRKYLKAICQT